MNLFYTPELSGHHQTLNPDESKHLIRVLRMKAGDRVTFTNGKGFFFDCRIEDDNPKACRLAVVTKRQGDGTQGRFVNMAVAPTKNITRYEWFLEKATEIGVGRITPIICKRSERRQIKTERLERILIAAMKQSLKSKLPQLDQPEKFSTFVRQPFEGEKYIAFFHPDVDDELSAVYHKGKPALILIGPEGGFCPAEVELAKQNGFKPVKLGPSRLRTETAAVVACHTVNSLNL